MNRTAWIVFIVLCVGFLGGLVWISKGKALDVSSVDTWAFQNGESRNGNIADHVYGNKDAKVRIIEYGDYQCPGCGQAYQPVKTVVEKYKDNVAFVFRNFPLPSLHPNARAAAAAAEAAGLQGKFWEMHDLLYSNQSSWENLSGTQRTDQFASYANQLGLNRDQFLKDITSSAVTDKIAYDQALGQKVGVSGTPSIYVNQKAITQYVHDGQLVDNPVDKNSDRVVWSSADSFEKFVVVPALKDAGVTIPSN